jgi:hypothetical protein
MSPAYAGLPFHGYPTACAVGYRYALLEMSKLNGVRFADAAGRCWTIHS